LSETLLKIQETFRKRTDVYKTIDLKIAAIKLDDKYYNCRSVALFSYEKDVKQIETMVETTNFVMFSLKLDAKTFFDTLLEITQTGKLSYHNKTILFTDNLDKPSVTPTFRDYVSGNSERSKDRLGIDWPIDYFLCEWHNNILQNELTNRKRIADKQVQCHDPPFESVVDTIQSLMNVERWDTALNGSHLLASARASW
jgi:hypothetical protein